MKDKVRLNIFMEIFRESQVEQVVRILDRATLGNHHLKNLYKIMCILFVWGGGKSQYGLGNRPNMMMMMLFALYLMPRCSRSRASRHKNRVTGKG